MNLELYQYNKKQTEHLLDDATRANSRIIMGIHVGITDGHKIGITMNEQVNTDDMIKALEIVTGALKQSQEKKSKSGLILPGKA